MRTNSAILLALLVLSVSAAAQKKSHKLFEGAVAPDDDVLGDTSLGHGTTTTTTTTTVHVDPVPVLHVDPMPTTIEGGSASIAPEFTEGVWEVIVPIADASIYLGEIQKTQDAVSVASRKAWAHKVSNLVWGHGVIIRVNVKNPALAVQYERIVEQLGAAVRKQEGRDTWESRVDQELAGFAEFLAEKCVDGGYWAHYFGGIVPRADENNHVSFERAAAYVACASGENAYTEIAYGHSQVSANLNDAADLEDFAAWAIHGLGYQFWSTLDGTCHIALP
jgi:hypothetical protein